MMKNKLPSLLLERLTAIYSKEELVTIDEAFALEKRPVYFRVNLIKSTPEEVESELQKNDISFTKDALPYCYKLEKGIERDLWKLKIYEEGKIYIQSFSSQLPVHFMELSEGMHILDMTAAPGGKTAQISERVGNSGKVVACELSTLRRGKMEYNLKKLGCENVEVIGIDACELHTKYPSESFDGILFDAPCSSEGSISYTDEKFLSDWSMKHITKNYERQKDILKGNIGLLKKGGILLYSTCTLAPEENEGVVHFLLCNFKELQMESIEFDYPHTKKGLKSFGKYIYKSEVEKSLRIVPNGLSEGFFIAKMRKA